MLTQLWADRARLNRYHFQLNIAKTNQCVCRQARKTVDHFLSDIGNGPYTGGKFYNVSTFTEVTYPSTCLGDHLPIIRARCRIRKQLEPYYELQSPWGMGRLDAN